MSTPKTETQPSDLQDQNNTELDFDLPFNGLEAVAGKNLFGLPPIRRAAPWAKKKKPLTAEQKRIRKEKWEAGAPARKARQEHFAAVAKENREKVAAMSAEELAEYKAKRSAQVKATYKRNKNKIQAGLMFPVKNIAKNMRKTFGYIKFTQQSAVFTAAVMEYMTAELLELAGNYADEHKKKRIVPRHIMLAIRNDEEIEKLIGKNSVVLPAVGTVVKTHHCLVQKRAGSMPAAYWDGMGMKEANKSEKKQKQMKKEDF